VPLYGSPARGEIPAKDVGIDEQKRANMSTPPPASGSGGGTQPN
jgi:hypothetical protein